MPEQELPRENKPLYRRLASTLRARIEVGEYPVGTLLPTEQELCDAYGTSRFTVREALRILGEDGLVERRQGRGTEVISATGRPRVAQSLSSLAQLVSYAQETHLHIDRVMTVVPDEELALQLGRSPGRRWVLAEGVRRTLDDSVICVSRIYVSDEFESVAPELKEASGAIYQHIATRYGVEPSQVHQTITTDPASQAIAAQLGIAPGAMTIQLLRRYLAADDRPILVSINWHDAENFSYTQVIRAG
jgi:DNA-binding GntR family transcriptional regulator